MLSSLLIKLESGKDAVYCVTSNLVTLAVLLVIFPPIMTLRGIDSIVRCISLSMSSASASISTETAT